MRPKRPRRLRGFEIQPDGSWLSLDGHWAIEKRDQNLWLLHRLITCRPSTGGIVEITTSRVRARLESMDACINRKNELMGGDP